MDGWMDGWMEEKGGRKEEVMRVERREKKGEEGRGKRGPIHEHMHSYRVPFCFQYTQSCVHVYLQPSICVEANLILRERGERGERRGENVLITKKKTDKKTGKSLSLSLSLSLLSLFSSVCLLSLIILLRPSTARPKSQERLTMSSPSALTHSL